MFLTVFVLLVFALLYWYPVRRQFARWGTSPDEIRRTMPGDSVIASPTHTATQAITVDSPPESIWPWLVQMGYKRGGLYSYDWLDRLFGFLDRPSATTILPEFQQLAVGDKIYLGPRVELTIVTLEPARALVLSNKMGEMEWVWEFGLYPIDGQRTRLISRGTEHMPKAIWAWLYMRVMEPAAFIMTRRMLLGLKQRAEAPA
jgi:hypothetical protein